MFKALSLYLISLIFLVSLGDNKPPLSYCSKDRRHELILENDSNYTYNYRFGYHLSHSKGIYFIDNKKLILSSNYRELNSSLIVPANYSESHKKNKDELEISIQTQLPKNELYKFSVLINNKVYQIGVDNVLLRANDERISTIQLKVERDSSIVTNIFPLRYSVYSDMYKVKNGESNLFNIKWDVSANIFTYEPLNDTLDLKRKIYWKKKDVMLKKSC